MRHIFLAFAFLLVACESEVVYEDDLPGRPETGTWVEVVPGGDTICARGTDYRFFVRGGDPNRVIIDFQGGGACWDSTTCGFADALFSDNAGDLPTFLRLLDEGVLGGIFDDAEGRDFRDWTIIHVPYCTGDVHWGNSVVEYSDDLTIEHRGYVNASTALDWVYTRYPDPERILVSGCSAGAYGAVLHSAYVADHYPSAQIAVLADSGAGIITDTFLADSLPNWNAQPAIPPFIDSLQRPLVEMSIQDLYIGIGEHFPDMRMAQTATAFDADQTFFYTAMGGMPQDWTPRFRASITEIDAALPNFAAFIPPGSVHCVTPYPYFHEREVNGVLLSDWTRDLIEGDTMPQTVACEGQECCDDPICDACLAGRESAYCRFCDSWPPGYSECAAP